MITPARICVALAAPALLLACQCSCGHAAPPTPVIEMEAQTKPPDPAPPPKPVPLLIRERIPLADLPTVTLSAPDLTAVLAEDKAAQAGKPPRRVGIRRLLSKPVAPPGPEDAASRWRTSSDGARWFAFTVQSPGAAAMRLHFEELTLPPGVRLLVFNATNAAEVFGPYDAAYLADRHELWTETVFANRVTVECSAQAGVDLNAVIFRLREVTHQYAGGQ